MVMEKIRVPKVKIATKKGDISGAERLAIWRRAQAVFSKRKIDLLKEYQKLRRRG